MAYKSLQCIFFELVDTDFTFKLDADVEIDFDFFNDMDYEEYDHILFFYKQ